MKENLKIIFLLIVFLVLAGALYYFWPSPVDMQQVPLGLTGKKMSSIAVLGVVSGNEKESSSSQSLRFEDGINSEIMVNHLFRGSTVSFEKEFRMGRQLSDLFSDNPKTIIVVSSSVVFTRFDISVTFDDPLIEPLHVVYRNITLSPGAPFEIKGLPFETHFAHHQKNS